MDCGFVDQVIGFGRIQPAFSFRFINEIIKSANFLYSFSIISFFKMTEYVVDFCVEGCFS